MSDAELAAEVDERIEALWGPELPVDDPFRDLAVAEQDPARVLWIDLEADVSEDNQIYVATLDQLEAISAGAFAPVGVAESWASETGPVTVSFDLDGARHELTPAYLEDWIDPGILVGINELHRRQRPAVRAVPRVRPDGPGRGPDRRRAHGAREPAAGASSRTAGRGRAGATART